MLLKKLITTSVVSALAAGSLLPLSTAANARDWNQKYRSAHVERDFDHDRGRFNRSGDHHRFKAWNRHNEWRGNRHHSRRNGRNIAIGAFAAILGLAIAAEASRSHNYRSYDND